MATAGRGRAPASGRRRGVAAVAASRRGLRSGLSRRGPPRAVPLGRGCCCELVDRLTLDPEVEGKSVDELAAVAAASGTAPAGARAATAGAEAVEGVTAARAATAAAATARGRRDRDRR